MLKIRPEFNSESQILIPFFNSFIKIEKHEKKDKKNNKIKEIIKNVSFNLIWVGRRKEKNILK